MLNIRKWDFQESRHYSLSQDEFEAEHKLDGFDIAVIRSLKTAFGRVLFSNVAKRVMVPSTLENAFVVDAQTFGWCVGDDNDDDEIHRIVCTTEAVIDDVAHDELASVTAPGKCGLWDVVTSDDCWLSAVGFAGFRFTTAHVGLSGFRFTNVRGDIRVPRARVAELFCIACLADREPDIYLHYSSKSLIAVI